MLDPSDDNYLDSTVSALVKRAIVLETKYKGMLHQCDEVELRIELLRDATDICKSDSKSSHVNSAMCQLCMMLHIPEVFSSGNLAHLHSPAHIALLQIRLAVALEHRYHHSYSSADVDESISLCRDALLFLNEHSDHISPVPTTACLGAGCYIRFTISAQQNDLQQALALSSSAVQTCPSELHYLADLGSILMHIYLESGSVDHLDESLVVLRRAHGLRMGHPARGKIWQLLAAATGQKDNQCGQRQDFCLEAVISHYKEVLLWQPLGHHSHFEGWDGLAIVFLMRFYRTNNIHFLNRAIHYGQTAHNMLNPQHPRAFRYSNNMSNAFQSRYNALGYPSDLELALSYAKRALDTGPPDRRSMLKRNLANIMASAAEYSGDVEMLSEAISVAREALDCVHQAERFLALQTLGLILIAKASHFGDTEYMKEGIYYMRQLLDRVDEETVYYTDGAVYASEALVQYYEMDPSQNFQALTEAMNLLERLRVEDIPEVYRARVLHCTASVYRAQFYHSGLPDMLKSAFAIDQQALDLRPPGHPRRCMSLAALSEDLVGISVISEFIDLENTIGMLQVALKDLAEGHPDFPKLTTSLAKLLLIPNTPYMNSEKAFSSLLHMLQVSSGSVYRCVVDMISMLRDVETNFASKWSVDNDARRQCLDVYQALINILPRLASLDLDLARRIQVLSQARDLATKASSHAIALGQFGRAIELLESGRAVFWAQHLRLRTSLDLLDHNTAKELRDISRRLEITASSNIPLDLDSNLARARMERNMAERRRLNTRFDELVSQVRSQPGMDRFLRNFDYMTLSSAAISGPVVILQQSWMSVITAPHTDPHVIPLHEVTDEWLQGAVNTLRLAADRSRNGLDDRGARKRPVNGIAAHSSDEYDILADIWRRIAQPLLDFLGWEKQDGRKRPRLFLCPTGIFTFLPIHAAGLYDPTSTLNTSCLSDFCIVSYTPTLASLIASRTNSNHLRREEIRLLLATAPDPCTSTALPEAWKEADAISQIVPARLTISNTLKESADTGFVWVSTAEDVLRLFPAATILHLACHGVQNAQEPLKSGFIMHDKMMEVADLIRLNLPQARLAFLSACETAQGDMERPDEALHLAATMLYAGFKSVIGTMWSMGDVDGPIVAETVYSELFAGNGEMLDFDVVPYALDAAVRKLRTRGLEPSRWAPYIHLGM